MSRPAILVAGPLAQLLVLWLPAPAGMEETAWRVAGLAVWMALWWLTTVIPLEATALLPLVVLPLTVGSGFREVAAPYADPIIFLFLGGFLIAAALERWELHRRLADQTLATVGSSGRGLVLAFLLVSAFLSMWISNTATAVMMLPIAAAAVGLEHGASLDDVPHRGLVIAVLLAVAYGSSIGGVATLIGTPPNALFAANARELAGLEVTFANWLPIGLSVSIPMLVACWWILVWLCRVPATHRDVARQPNRSAAEPLASGERFVAGVFVAAALAWILRTPKELGELRVPGLTDLVPGLTDSGIALVAALALFAVPLRGARHRFALDWDTARHVPWGVLLLFGGGLALAAAFESSGLSGWIGGRLHGLAGLPLPVLIGVVTTLFVFLTELTSNTATAALGVPLMAGVADGVGVAPAPLMVAAALAASMAFMLPVATPPNAIVFGHGVLRVPDMARVGIALNLVAILVITVVASLWAP
jgi:sodium-dependent dicarboxylate transporter 2/3/5